MEFEQIYTNTIEKLYGKIRTPHLDQNLLLNNVYPHEYSILERVDLTHLEVFTIDPEGCEDADDAFSIFYDQGGLFLALHIADPTEFINLQSSL